MTRPVAENSAAPPARPGRRRAPWPTRRTWALVPVASFIWEATVRFQISS